MAAVFLSQGTLFTVLPLPVVFTTGTQHSFTSILAWPLEAFNPRASEVNLINSLLVLWSSVWCFWQRLISMARLWVLSGHCGLCFAVED